MFNSMDTDGSGTITFEELKAGLSRLGSLLSESEIRQLLNAVSSVHGNKRIKHLSFFSIY